MATVVQLQRMAAIKKEMVALIAMVVARPSITSTRLKALVTMEPLMAVFLDE